MKRIVLALCVIGMGMCGLAAGQTVGENIDLYFSDWHNMTPRTTMGSLTVRDIYTKGDPQHPAKKAAVLKYITSYTYSTLAAHAATKPTKLNGQQQIYFV